jgi:hypothetical protein
MKNKLFVLFFFLVLTAYALANDSDGENESEEITECSTEQIQFPETIFLPEFKIENKGDTTCEIFLRGVKTNETAFTLPAKSKKQIKILSSEEGKIIVSTNKEKIGEILYMPGLFPTIFALIILFIILKITGK